MMRLIDADAIKNGKFHSIEDWTPIEQASWQWGWNDAIDAIINGTPTVDAVEVVRCKECENWGTRARTIDNDGNTMSCDCLALDRMTKADFYCAWGERKDEVAE